MDEYVISKTKKMYITFSEIKLLTDSTNLKLVIDSYLFVMQQALEYFKNAFDKTTEEYKYRLNLSRYNLTVYNNFLTSIIK